MFTLSNVPIILTLRKGEHRTDARNTIATVYKNVFFEDKGIGSIRADGARVTCRGQSRDRASHEGICGWMDGWTKGRREEEGCDVLCT